MIEFRRIKLVLIFLIPIVISIYFLIAWHRDPILSDGREYDTLAKNIISLKGYTLNGITPYALRPPLYSLFVALLYMITKCNPTAVVIVQIFLVAFIPYFLYKILIFAGFEEKRSFFAALSVALYPFGYIYVQQLVTEPLTTFLFVISSYFVVRVWLNDDLKFCEVLISGIIITLPALSKSQHISLISALVVSLTIKGFIEKDLLKKVKLKIIPLLLGALIVLSPWALRNYYHFKDPAILGEGAFGELLLKGFYETKGRFLLLTFWNEKNSGELQSFKDWKSKMDEAEMLSKQEKVSLGVAKKKIAIEQIKKEPLEAIRGYIVRFYSFWVMIPTEQSNKIKFLVIVVEITLLILSAIGFVMFYKPLINRLFPIYLCILAENAILALGHMEARYSITLKVFIIMCIGFLLSELIERLSNVRKLTISYNHHSNKE